MALFKSPYEKIVEKYKNATPDDRAKLKAMLEDIDKAEDEREIDKIEEEKAESTEVKDEKAEDVKEESEEIGKEVDEAENEDSNEEEKEDALETHKKVFDAFTAKVEAFMDKVNSIIEDTQDNEEEIGLSEQSKEYKSMTKPKETSDEYIKRIANK